MSNYTLTESCPECGSEEIQVIDREYDYEDECHKARHICWTCNHDWWEEEE